MCVIGCDESLTFQMKSREAASRRLGSASSGGMVREWISGKKKEGSKRKGRCAEESKNQHKQQGATLMPPAMFLLLESSLKIKVDVFWNKLLG